ncbi:hypothetical protein FA13DRAFT_1188876 [Coprinellus micaceus]|uniref:Uncharacterized protein n=1 Tax=Coprinellus micaceus TaxID=71717 RepID=A0A4Y7SU28_COPMI|nr:hypothetical protein FA13DRAFT_1188876 [Coprinellus micaceus]
MFCGCETQAVRGSGEDRSMGYQVQILTKRNNVLGNPFQESAPPSSYSENRIYTRGLCPFLPFASMWWRIGARFRARSVPSTFFF